MLLHAHATRWLHRHTALGTICPGKDSQLYQLTVNLWCTDIETLVWDCWSRVATCTLYHIHLTLWAFVLFCFDRPPPAGFSSLSNAITPPALLRPATLPWKCSVFHLNLSATLFSELKASSSSLSVSASKFFLSQNESVFYVWTIIAVSPLLW